jgi:hypothetical protein
MYRERERRRIKRDLAERDRKRETQDGGTLYYAAAVEVCPAFPGRTTLGGASNMLMREDLP